MELRRRAFLATMAGVGVAVAAPGVARAQGAAAWRKRLTGTDLDTASRWQVAGTELGIPYAFANGSVGYLFGHTFSAARPESGAGWRSPVILKSTVHPAAKDGLVFNGAIGLRGNGLAPAVMHSGQNGLGIDGVWEVAAVPTDGISFPEDGHQLISYSSVEHRAPGPRNSLWKTNYSGLAYSDNGKDFVRTNLKWWNNADNSDPYQLWTMQRDGDWVYVFSVAAGRQDGGMMLRRVRWDRMLHPAEYEGWGWNGRNWYWNRACTPILTGRFGEPSVRRLSDGTWVMSYLNAATNTIVTRTAAGPNCTWSAERAQVTWAQEPGLYGGFIHPWSSSKPNELHLLVSTWRRTLAGRTTAYHVSQYVGTV
ncbi:DUF4185 domain-containing protein [Kribbella albertanoniae]|uniref:DUF4185 domain-containing protein n=1 Tax=Kribbella albertanoniae TaxID=1266829 RepID=A0A4R4QHL0_9ACTN|nr:DUF4185 domain-containing protein [Kribbella albertanoniae]TDC34672.1 DUF4185 domain-containing protein [Kribbella albertanoniae]